MPPELIGVSMIFPWPEVRPLAQITLRTPWLPLARPMSARVSLPLVTCDQWPGPPVGDAIGALAAEAAVKTVPASRAAAAAAAAAVVTLMLSMTVRMEPPGGLQYWRSC